MKKRILVSAFVFVILFSSMVNGTVYAKPAILSNKACADVELRTGNYIWEYKTINGVLYRRLYDVKNQCWIGDWEPCP